ncbi:hypothetical protein L21TH_2001 [Caldisalinibacter kiritimatiensis]|uniref:PRC-barrel domain-containing protein n=2 Tax=Caldisalinibacter kiritimatiensis TaxID=1304284 RepID=R1ATK2_9FIRM|nr:hypothetical protein L21TH_2001 [Caldisalinibacter kiritimatiensis]
MLGVPVISKKEGEKIAEVEKLIYNYKKFRVNAILLNGKGLFKEPQIVRFKNIEAIGKDAIVLKDKKYIDKASAIPEIEESISAQNSIIEKEIITEDGESLGYIQDVIIEPEKGKILGFVLTEGLIQDILDGRSIFPYRKGIKFGNDALIITSKMKEDYIKNKKEYKKILELE